MQETILHVTKFIAISRPSRIRPAHASREDVTYDRDQQYRVYDVKAVIVLRQKELPRVGIRPFPMPQRLSSFRHAMPDTL